MYQFGPTENGPIVIASEAKHHSAAKGCGLLRRFAPRNDEKP